MARGPCSLVVASSRKENVQRHVLRLLVHLHHRVAPSKLQALQKALEPTGQVGAPTPLILSTSVRCLCGHALRSPGLTLKCVPPNRVEKR